MLACAGGSIPSCSGESLLSLPMEQKKRYGKLFLLYLQCYFISIATILGTGILGLPVTLYKSGFYPFLLTFTLNYIMQVLVVFQMMEVLQYCKAILSGHATVSFSPLTDESQEVPLMKRKSRNEKKLVMFDIQTRSETSDNASVGESDASDDNNDIEQDDADFTMVKPDITEPDLHIISKLFLNRYMHPFFLLVIFSDFFAIIITYSLAGAEAYGQVLGIKHTTVIPFFTWLLSIVIITTRQYIRPVIAVLTLAKGSLLCATVVVTVSASATVNRSISDDWKSVAMPFLMGSVALGGGPTVMPMLFDKFEVVRDQMKGFRNSIVAGITTCFILNIMWSWAVLKVVPQSHESCQVLKNMATSSPQNSTFIATLDLDSATATGAPIRSCDPEMTLEAAKDEGEISTVPLIKIIQAHHTDITWVASVIQLFIVISITVSFLTIGSAMQHTVCGWVDDTLEKYHKYKLTWTCCSFLPTNWFWHYLIGLICFAIIFIFAMVDPKGFVSILEKLASFGLNMMSGIFMFLMVRAARSSRFGHIRISLPTHQYLRFTHYATLVFYTFAVLYDVVITIMGK